MRLQHILLTMSTTLVSLNANLYTFKLYLKCPDHCLELIRESIMCKGDPSLTTFEWADENDPLGFTAVAHSHHRCVKWDSLLGWVRKRAVPIFDPGTLEKHGKTRQDF